ncbi:MAG: serine hydrolase domain-containing protein [Pseudomonadota bacterium]
MLQRLMVAGFRRLGKPVLLAFLTVVLSAGRAYSAAPEVNEKTIGAINTHLENAVAAGRFPGVSVALIADGDIKYAEGFGVTEMPGAAVTPDTSFFLGSVSKPITAIAILQLVDEGKIDLDAPLHQYIDWFLTLATPGWDAVTVRDLLRHQSGLSTLQGNLNQISLNQSPSALYEAARTYACMNLAGLPGERFVYSNANYQLLGYLLETVESKPYDAIITTRIINRLGLKNSFVYPESRSDESVAKPHVFIFDRLQRNDRPISRTITPQAGVAMSARDLSAVILDLMADNPRLLSPEIRDAMYEIDGDIGYSFGLMVDRRDGLLGLRHGGQNAGFKTEMGFFPDLQLGYVVLANASDGGVAKSVSDTLHGVTDIISGATPRKAERPQLFVYFFGFLVAASLGSWIYLGLLIKKHLKSGAEKPSRLRLNWRWTSRVLAPSTVLAGLSYGLLFKVTQTFGAPLSAAVVFKPELGIAIYTAALTFLAIALIRLFLVRSG